MARSRTPSRRLAWTLAAMALAAACCGPAAAQERIQPSAADPQVRRHDEPSMVYGGEPERRDAPLAVYLPGTGGTSEHPPEALLRTVESLGYRVIFLTYDNEPSVSEVCPRAPADCSSRFRTSRLFGGGEGDPVQTPPAEAIVPRLVALLRDLDREHPDAGWGQYLTQDGPAWPRVVVSGLSQGAGMAAFLAKRYPVRRVVLFSSPWDVTGPDHRPAPWLYDKAATPPERWWAERHLQEKTTGLIAAAYQALKIPPDHILLFDGPEPPEANGPNPFHGSTVRLPLYAPQWRTLFGVAGGD